MLGPVVCLASCVTHRLEPCPERRASKQIALSRPATSTKPSAKNANKTAAIEKASYTRKSAPFQYASTSSSQPKAKKEAIQYNVISFPIMRLCRKAHEDDLNDSKGLIMIRGSVNLNHPDLSLHVSCSRDSQTLWVNKPHKFLWSHWFTAKSFFLLSTRKIPCHLLWQRLTWFVASVAMLIISSAESCFNDESTVASLAKDLSRALWMESSKRDSWHWHHLPISAYSWLVSSEKICHINMLGIGSCLNNIIMIFIFS